MVESIGASGPAGFEKKIKYAAMIVSILTLVIGVITFFVQQSNQADTRERESRAKFLAKQLDVYAVAVQTVSELSLDPNIDKDEEKYKQNLRIFSQLYYGQMAMVEGPDVAEVMEAIKKLGAVPDNAMRCYEGRHEKESIKRYEAGPSDGAFCCGHDGAMRGGAGWCQPEDSGLLFSSPA